MAKGSRPSSARAILLSIRPEHAERIFQGSKRFELRKIIPSAEFGRVFLYETGGRGVVGCFDVGLILKKRIDALWNAVGSAATTKERFFQYFSPVKQGFAIEVKNPTRFENPVSLKSLNGEFGKMAPPQSFLLLESGDPNHSLLEQERAIAARNKPAPVKLTPIRAENRKTYKKLVFRHIGPNYGDIDDTFAASTLRIHDLGYDPAGFFTTKKQVLEIRNSHDKLIGFTTLTFKSGGCVKTGPTILLKSFRNQGYGRSTRIAIEEYVRPERARKIYCTCPEKADDVVRYLLASGMRIEAHLERHYAVTHNELVFGKLLVADEPNSSQIVRAGRRVSGRVCDPLEFGPDVLAKDFACLFEQTWAAVTAEFARQIVEESVYKPTDNYASKPKRLVCLKGGKHCIAAVALLPKRGGAVKGLLLRSTSHRESLRNLITAASGLAVEMTGRKLYFLHPLFDSAALGVLRSTGFLVEGLLRAPYRPGQDAVVLSKFL